jgi:Protein of unknown function (DUF3043)
MTEQETNKVGKGRPTPSRKEREQANLRPIVGARTPEARKAERARAAEARRAARDGAMNGEDRYLTARDKGPQKRMVRDFVDSKFSAGEFLMPALVISVILTFIDNPAIQTGVMVALYVFMIVLVFNAVMIGRAAKKLLEREFGADRVEAGIVRYAAMRSAQSRFLRMPKPTVGRGSKK